MSWISKYCFDYFNHTTSESSWQTGVSIFRVRFFWLLECTYIRKLSVFVDFYLQLFSILHGIDPQIAFYCVSVPFLPSFQSHRWLTDHDSECICTCWTDHSKYVSWSFRRLQSRNSLPFIFRGTRFLNDCRKNCCWYGYFCYPLWIHVGCWYVPYSMV